AQVLRDSAFLAIQAQVLKQALAAAQPHETPAMDVLDDPEHGCQKIVVRLGHNGATRETVVDHVLLTSPDYAELSRLRREFAALGSAPHQFAVKADGAAQTATTPIEL